MRQLVVLSSQELANFAKLPEEPDFAWGFWKQVAYKRGLDAKSLMWRNNQVTGLPLGHTKHWCFPEELKSRVKIRKEK